MRLQLRRNTHSITLKVSFNGTGSPEVGIVQVGDLTLARAAVIVGGRALTVATSVFADDDALMPLSDVAAFIDAHSNLPHKPLGCVGGQVSLVPPVVILPNGRGAGLG